MGSFESGRGPSPFAAGPAPAPHDATEAARSATARATNGQWNRDMAIPLRSRRTTIAIAARSRGAKVPRGTGLPGRRSPPLPAETRIESEFRDGGVDADRRAPDRAVEEQQPADPGGVRHGGDDVVEAVLVDVDEAEFRPAAELVVLQARWIGEHRDRREPPGRRGAAREDVERAGVLSA